jgi:hypothetical protein
MPMNELTRPPLLPWVPDDEAPTSPRAASLVHYWYACRRPPLVPSRADFNAFKLRPWLGSISIYQAVDGGGDFRVALDGTDVVALTGEDWTGRRTSDVDREFEVTICAELQAVLASGVPTIRRIGLLQKSWRSATRVCLPIARSDLRPADQVFLALFAD